MPFTFMDREHTMYCCLRGCCVFAGEEVKVRRAAVIMHIIYINDPTSEMAVRLYYLFRSTPLTHFFAHLPLELLQQL